LHKAVKKVTGDLERMAFNTAVAAMMVFVNEATKAENQVSRSQALRFVQILAPFAPHLGEELWQRLGIDSVRRPLTYEPWPTWDEALLVENSVELAVQVNGKVRGKITVPVDFAEEQVLAAARQAVDSQLAGKTVVKQIVVPGRLVNLVIK
jgi:leucyl-tRNA synthetase